MKNIVILMAMADEAQGLIEHLGLVRTTDIIDSKLPMICYQKTLNGINLSVVVSGIDVRHDVDNIGSEAATLMAYEAISKLHPELIISAGTAGGFSMRGAEIGTVYLSEQHFVYHDRHVPLPGFEQSAVGLYPALQISTLAKALDLPTGVISTGSSLEKNAKDSRVIERHNVVAKEMEAAGIAWVAMLFNIPMIAMKSITNLLDEDNKSEQEFLLNLSYSTQCLTEKLIELLDYL